MARDSCGAGGLRATVYASPGSCLTSPAQQHANWTLCRVFPVSWCPRPATLHGSLLLHWAYAALLAGRQNHQTLSSACALPSPTSFVACRKCENGLHISDLWYIVQAGYASSRSRLGHKRSERSATLRLARTEALNRWRGPFIGLVNYGMDFVALRPRGGRKGPALVAELP